MWRVDWRIAGQSFGVQPASALPAEVVASTSLQALAPTGRR